MFSETYENILARNLKNETYEKILERNLKRLPNDVDKREGAIGFDAIAPACMEFAEIYILMQFILEQTSILTANREGLINWGRIFSILPEPATYAQAKAIFNIDVPIGARFNKDSLNFRVVEKLEGEHTYKMVCENIGSVGNNCIGRINPIENITGLKTAEIVEITTPGEDDEDTEVYRKRFLKAIKSKAYGGNADDYIQKVNAIKGVGDCKVYRCPRGGGTVDVVIINSDNRPPSAELVKDVQDTLMPTRDGCGGLGVAPIGHDVLVKGVTATPINVSMHLYLEPNVTFDQVKPQIIKAITGYFEELAKAWAKSDVLTVRTAHILSAVLRVNGVNDITNVLVNGNRERVELKADEVPTVGSVVNV